MAIRIVNLRSYHLNAQEIIIIKKGVKFMDNFEEKIDECAALFSATLRTFDIVTSALIWCLESEEK